jgi:hypothetical protein
VCENEVSGRKGICYWQGTACEVSGLNQVDESSIVSPRGHCPRKIRYCN